jgi:hypothetical protein
MARHWSTDGNDVEGLDAPRIQSAISIVLLNMRASIRKT